jgi:hypothetical protein
VPFTNTKTFTIPTQKLCALVPLQQKIIPYKIPILTISVISVPLPMISYSTRPPKQHLFRKFALA